MRLTLLGSVVIALALATPARAEQAQTTVLAPADTVQVLLTLTPRLAHPSARATIVRPVGPGAPDIIMVTGETTPADLRQAIRMLMDARHTFGPSVSREMQAHVAAADVTPTDLEDESAYLASLRAAAEVEIPGLGLQRSIFVALEEKH